MHRSTLIFALAATLAVAILGSCDMGKKVKPAACKPSCARAQDGPARYWWVEVNSQAGDYYTIPMRSCKAIWPWARPIVTTRVQQVETLYPRLAADLPGVPIIGGLKLSNFMAGTDPFDPEQWKSLGINLSLIVALTGQDVVVIEAEGALKLAMDAGTYAVPDDGTLGACLSAIPKSVKHVWFWPLSYGSYLPLHEAMHRLDARVRPVSDAYGWGDGFHPLTVKEQAAIASGAIATPVDIRYVGASYQHGYTIEQARTLGLPGRVTIIYPGATHSLEAAQAIRGAN